MSRSVRQAVTLVLAAAILAGGVLVAIKISRHSRAQAVPAGSQPSVTYSEPTVVGTTPGQTAPSPGSVVQDQGSYAVAVPAGSSGVNSIGGAQHELRFQVDNRYSVDVQSQPLRPGESFEEIATLYGQIDQGQKIRFGGHRGLLFKNISGGYVTWTAVGFKGRTVYTLQTYGPKRNVRSARKLILHLAAAATLKQS